MTSHPGGARSSMLTRVTMHRLFNPGPSPVVYDDEGHQIPVGGFVDADLKGDRVARLVEHRVLLDKGTTRSAEKAADKES